MTEVLRVATLLNQHYPNVLSNIILDYVYIPSYMFGFGSMYYEASGGEYEMKLNLRVFMWATSKEDAIRKVMSDHVLINRWMGVFDVETINSLTRSGFPGYWIVGRGANAVPVMIPPGHVGLPQGRVLKIGKFPAEAKNRIYSALSAHYSRNPELLQRDIVRYFNEDDDMYPTIIAIKNDQSTLVPNINLV